MTKDTRWIQRLCNWTAALNKLTRFMERAELNELEELGLIQSFKYNHELAWKVQKDFLEAQGVTELFGARNVVRKAFETGLIDNGNVWMEMVKSRNLSVHTYNEETKIYIVNAIVDSYFAAFCALHRKLSELAQQEQNEG